MILQSRAQSTPNHFYALSTLLSLLLLLLPLSSSSLIQWEQSKFFRVSAWDYKATLATSVPCRVQYQKIPKAWLSFNNELFIPHSYSLLPHGSIFPITIRLVCGEEPTLVETNVVLKDRWFYWAEGNAGKERSGTDQDTVEDAENERGSIGERKQEAKEQENRQGQQNGNRETSMQEQNNGSTIIKSENLPISSLSELPTSAQLSQLLQQNNTLQISTVIQQTVSSAIPCREKTAYLQELSGLLTVHILSLNATIQRNRVLADGSASHNQRLEGEVEYYEGMLRGINLEGKRDEYMGRMRELEKNYMEYNSVIFEITKVKAVKQKVETMQDQFKFKDQVGSEQVKNVKETVIDMISPLGEKFLEVSNQIKKSRTAIELSNKLAELSYLLSLQTYLLQKQQTLLKYSISSLEIDTQRSFDSYQSAQQSSAQANRKLESLKQTIYANNVSIVESARENQPILREMEQLSIYVEAIEGQLDLMYFQCYGISEFVVKENMGAVDISMAEEVYDAYLEEVYQVEQGEVQTLMQRIMPPNNTATANASTQGTTTALSPSSQNIDPTPSIASNNEGKVSKKRVYISSQNETVTISRITVVNRKWMNEYGEVQNSQSFSCIASEGEQSGIGLIKIIWKEMIMVEDTQGEILTLRISPCTRIETVGSILPQVGQKILWRGQPFLTSINTIKVSAF